MKHIFTFLLALSALMNIGCDDGNNVRTTVEKLPVKKGYPAIYIKKRTWGLTRDKRTVVISNDATTEFFPNSTSEYVYNGLFTMFYKFERDTLFVYTPVVVPAPENFKSTYAVVQKQLSNPEMMDLLDNKNYEKLHLIEL